MSVNEKKPLIETKVKIYSGTTEPLENAPFNSGFTWKSRVKSMLYLLLSTPVWASLAVLVKVYSYLPVIQVLWLRYFVQYLLAFVLLNLAYFDIYKDENLDKGETYLDLMWGPKLSTDGRKIRWVVILRALTDFLSICCFYFAIALIPVGDAASVFFLYNMLVFIAAYFCFGDPLGVVGIFNCLLSFVGVILTTQPAFIFGANSNEVAAAVYTFHGAQLVGILFAFFGAVFLTISLIAIRYSSEVHWLQMVQAAGFTNAAFSGPVCMIVITLFAWGTSGDFTHTFKLFDGEEYLFCFILGVLGFLALMCMVQGYQGVESGTGALIAYLELPLTYIFQWIFLKDVPNWITWLGVVCIIIAATFQTVYTMRINKTKEKVEGLQSPASPRLKVGEILTGSPILK